MKLLDADALSRRIEQRAKEDLALCNIGGATVLVVQDGKEIYKKHFCGSVEVSDDTLFRLASMTKPISAVAAMMLVERGELSLDDGVGRFLPAFSDMEVLDSDGTMRKAEKSVTVKDLLTHSSGVGSGAAWDHAIKRITPRDMESVDAFVDFLSGMPLSFTPGSKQEYSGVGAFSLLTAIIQKISGTSYEEFLKKELFEPCRMVDTTFSPSEEQWGRMITMHDKIDGKSVVGETYDGCVFGSFPPKSYLGGAGLISSTADYLNFARMLLDGGIFEGRRVLRESSVAEISKPQFFKRPEVSWGLGVRVITGVENTSLPIGTYGWSGAYGTHFFIDPKNRIIGIYMKNSQYDGGSSAITSKNFEIDLYSSMNGGAI